MTRKETEGPPEMARRALVYSTHLHHAKVFEGVAKSDFILKAVVFKSQKRALARFLVNLPPPKLWRGSVFHAPRKVDMRLHGKGNSNSHGARPVY